MGLWTDWRRFGAPALLLAGLAVGVLFAAFTQRDYRSVAILEARGDEPEREARTAMELLDSRPFLERIRPQVLGGRLSSGELADRVDAEVREDTPLVEVVATAAQPDEARSLGVDVAAALVDAAATRVREDSELVENEIGDRLAALDRELRAAAPGSAEKERLERRRAALERRSAEAAASAAKRAIVLAAPAAPDGRTGAPAWLNVLGGFLLGLVLAGGALALDTRPRGERSGPATIAGLEDGAVVSGVVSLAADPPGSRFEISADGTSWTPVARAWDTTAERDGRHLVRAAGGKPVSVVVDNTAPTVALVEPRPNAAIAGEVQLTADARDAASGVASVAFLLSDGSPDWRTLETGPRGEWHADALAPGTYWLCAVATDRAGHQAASVLVPVRVP